MIKKRKAQEEIIGFGLIIIIVSIILLVFLSIYLRSSDTTEVESYEVEGFIQAVLQHTSECEDSGEFLSVQDLLFSCYNEETCDDGTEACEILETLLTEICEISWNAGEDSPIKGYALTITADEEEILSIEAGNSTSSYKGAVQDFAKRGKDYEIIFNAYYS